MVGDFYFESFRLLAGVVQAWIVYFSIKMWTLQSSSLSSSLHLVLSMYAKQVRTKLELRDSLMLSLTFEYNQIT